MADPEKVELDPKVLQELSAARELMTDAMGRLSLLEMELRNYIDGEKK